MRSPKCPSEKNQTPETVEGNWEPSRKGNIENRDKIRTGDGLVSKNHIWQGRWVWSVDIKFYVEVERID